MEHLEHLNSSKLRVGRRKNISGVWRKKPSKKNEFVRRRVFQVFLPAPPSCEPKHDWRPEPSTRQEFGGGLFSPEHPLVQRHEPSHVSGR
jgi:hypothetical protein